MPPILDKFEYNGTNILKGGTIIIAKIKFSIPLLNLSLTLARGYAAIAPTTTIIKTEKTVMINEFFIAPNIFAVSIAVLKLPKYSSVGNNHLEDMSVIGLNATLIVI